MFPNHFQKTQSGNFEDFCRNEEKQVQRGGEMKKMKLKGPGIIGIIAIMKKMKFNHRNHRNNEEHEVQRGIRES